jgi:hypothetical protein
MESTVDKVRYTLQLLGGTSDSIAATLKEKGIKGKRGSSCNCPIANYLRKQGFVGVSVSRWEIDAAVGEWGVDALTVTTHTSNPIHFFINRFDDGNYPELVA